MGLFDRSSELDKTIKNINENTNYYLNEKDFYKYIETIGNESLFCNILKKLIEANITDEYNIHNDLSFICEKLYPLFVHDNLRDIDSFNVAFKVYLENPFLVNSVALDNIQFAFNDKSLVAEVFKYLNSDEIFGNVAVNSDNVNLLTEYLKKARTYYVDDRALFSSFINLIDMIGLDEIKFGDTKRIERCIKNKLKQDAKMNGVYDIDQATLKEMDRKIEKVGLLSERLNTLIETAEKQGKILDETVDNVSEEISRARIEEINSLRDKANNIIKEFEATYLKLLGKERKNISSQADEIMNSVANEIERKRMELLDIGDSVGQRIGLEISRINTASDNTISRIRNFISTDENVKRLLNEAKEDEDFISRLKLVENLAVNLGNAGSSSATANVSPDSETSTIITSNSNTKGNSILDNLVVPSLIIPKEKEVDSRVNYYFDPRIPYKDRFNQLMEKKQKMIENGEIFHEKFDEILAMILLNDAPYMYGPSGCGKTFMIDHQLAKLLDMSVLINGYIMYEQDVLGYTNAGTGGYVPSNFYRCFKYGNPIFFDELDNGIANATTVLNSFLTSKVGSKFVFPNGEEVKKHPNFRIISAGNTKGSGKTVAHNTRQKMDESVMQRLTPVEVTYDNRIEKNILKDYPGWFEFATAFREAVAACGSSDEENTIGTFTTRDAETIKKYKDNDALTDEQLIEYQIIENKDEDYLKQIKRKLENHNFENDDAKKLIKTFNTKIEERFTR